MHRRPHGAGRDRAVSGNASTNHPMASQPDGIGISCRQQYNVTDVLARVKSRSLANTTRAASDNRPCALALFSLCGALFLRCFEDMPGTGVFWRRGIVCGMRDYPNDLVCTLARLDQLVAEVEELAAGPDEKCRDERAEITVAYQEQVRGLEAKLGVRTV